MQKTEQYNGDAEIDSGYWGLSGIHPGNSVLVSSSKWERVAESCLGVVFGCTLLSLRQNWFGELATDTSNSTRLKETEGRENSGRAIVTGANSRCGRNGRTSGQAVGGAEETPTRSELRRNNGGKMAKTLQKKTGEERQNQAGGQLEVMAVLL